MRNLFLPLFFLGLIAGIFLDTTPEKQGAKERLDFELIKSDRQKLFQAIKYKNGRENRDYSYCEDENSIYDVIDESVKNKLVIVCKYEAKSEFSHVRFFKYSELFLDGTLNFCGWRDFNYSFNAYTKRWEHKYDSGYSTKAYSNEKNCTNFNIKKYAHGI
ncbi:hypothetical protein [Pseudoalteromonas sp. OANN1]|uniref:hypothetical protein n=1 Tax=Pseudoalteromonas sp. OANN1 TaxID=2954497 RepID=UPI002096ED2C|nr:hypothetical protein [Pseudoalteromonas sp. OANN1]MCO7198174.1 hypothetical protein [Pseudoalteromonas sp. OANN1]